jgi:hypothetical protein
MGIGTLVRYLIGDREAILAIAGSRHALWLGLLFVLSAGFARDYDGEDLLAEPWHLLIPLGASLASSFVLFTLAYGVACCRGERWGALLPHYLSFLGLFWLTAPLAWLYAIPYERFLGPVASVQANLTTLGVVSAWRVALMVRVLVVALGYRALAAICLVMLFADAVALPLLQFAPVPLINVMGGIRMTESEKVVQGAALSVFLLGSCSLPFWLLATIFTAPIGRPGWQVPASPAAPPRPSLVGLAVLAVVIWFPVLPFTQPEQQRRRQVERLYQAGDVEGAIALMMQHGPAAFPPHWDPPPRVSGGWAGNYIPEVLDLLEHLDTIDAPDWVRAVYLEKIRGLLTGEFRFTDEQWERAVAVLERIDRGQEVLEAVRQWRKKYNLPEPRPPDTRDR